MAIVKIFKYDRSSKSYLLNTKRHWDVLYIDPPNRFKMMKTGGSFKSGSSQNYKTMTIEKICDLPVSDIANDDAIIFLWMQTAISAGNDNNYGDRMLDAWDFTKFRTKLYWDKLSIGMGANYRNQIEELWVATRGNVKALHMTRQSTHVEHKRLPHSVKPDIFRKIIEESTIKLFDKKPKMIEIFKRHNPQHQKMYLSKWDYFGSNLR